MGIQRLNPMAPISNNHERPELSVGLAMAFVESASQLNSTSPSVQFLSLPHACWPQEYVPQQTSRTCFQRNPTCDRGTHLEGYTVISLNRQNSKKWREADEFKMWGGDDHHARIVKPYTEI